MTPRYILAPQAAQDLFAIWQYIKRQGGQAVADRVESVIRDRIAFLSENPGAGHWRGDITNHKVKFFSVYSYLVVYRPETKPLQIVSILHGRRDVERLLLVRI
ncbi:MAG TPA: type II toxin-antitoxin system RelE/ParE family toxin [Terriglobales bacterium]|jgi:antitoxin ParD1/3/4/toxin ParE1/3/4